MPKALPNAYGYRGIYHNRTEATYTAKVHVAGRIVYSTGWPDLIQAAIARDRMVLHYGIDAELNEPAKARAAGPASNLQLRQIRRGLLRRSEGAFVGVYRHKVHERWEAKLTLPDGQYVSLGNFPRAEDAALARDRVAVGQGGQALNFPDRALEPASIEEMRAWASQLTKTRLRQRGNPKLRHGAYAGAAVEKDGWWRAYLFFGGHTTRLGSYGSKREAAIARDRVVLGLGLDLELNEPRAARRAGPLSIEEARRLAKGNRRTSRYEGVHLQTATGTWHATVRAAKKLIAIAQFDTEIEAAIARDRVVRAQFSGEAPLNFPERRLTPASIDEVRRRCAQAVKDKRTSQFRGVENSARYRVFRCLASILVDGRTHGLGAYRSEREAAIAHDRGALHLVGKGAKLNFPSEARALGPATPVELRAEARRRFKETTTSQYRGVCWNPKKELWVAQIGVERRNINLGLFEDEERAAEAYDQAARKYHRRKATLNFPEE